MNNNTMFSIGLALCKRTKLDVQGFIERKILRTTSNREAERLFWMTPELVENLLSFLDPASILALAKTHPLTREVLQSGINWTRFLERSCPKQSFTLRPRFQRLLPPDQPWTHKLRTVSLMEHYASEDLEPIIEILMIIGKPESHLLKLLDLLCENFPPYVTEREIRDYVKVACPCQEVHDVSPFGFGLLEKVERSTGTCHQQVDAIRMWSMCKEHVKYACRQTVVRQTTEAKGRDVEVWKGCSIVGRSKMVESGGVVGGIVVVPWAVRQAVVAGKGFH